MAGMYDEPCQSSPRDLKAHLEARLEAANKEKAKLEAGLRFLAANPDAQALLELIR